MNTETQQIRFTRLDHLALWFSRKIDNNLLIYTILKDLNVYIRYFIYIFLPASIFLSLIFLVKFFISLNPFDLNMIYLNMIDKGFIVVAFIAFLMNSLIIFYEPFYRDKRDLKELKLQEQEIKRLKKIRKAEFWRLRNMNLFFRFLIYVSVIFITLPVFYISPILNAIIITWIVMFEAKKFNFI